MRRTWAILSLLVLLALGACGKPSARESRSLPGGEPESRGESPAPEGGSAQALTPADGGEAEQNLLRLSEVRLSPEPLTAESGLTAAPIPLDALPEDAKFEFRWIVNGMELEDASGPTLEPGRFQKKQWLRCRARAVAGDRTGPWQSSRHVLAQNLPPRITAQPIEDFSVPGQVSYQIIASDPDGDPLLFALITPLEEGIAIDPASGLLTWTLDATIVERLGEAVEIKFRVQDNDGGGSNGSVTLQFTSTTNK